jgi:nitrite reductase/ring-hydroxylating ferredoxin subunit
MLVSFSSRGPLRQHWYSVARTDDVQNKPVAIELLSEQLVLWRGPSGRVIAAPDRCTHSKANLSLGEIEDGCLTCPKHGWTFGEDGRCVNNPRRDVIEDTAHLTTFACEERHGLVWVCLGSPCTDIPTAAAAGDPAFRRANALPVRWNTPAPRIVEALLEQWFDDGSQSGFDIPFTYRRSMPIGNDFEAHLLVACSPLGAGASLAFPVVWSNDTATSSEDLLNAEVTAIAALKPAVEAVSGMFELDEDALDEDADGGSAWRRALLDAVSAPV